MKMVKVYLNLGFFAVFLKKRSIIYKIRRSNVTDYAALIAGLPGYNVYCIKADFVDKSL